jgi:hypothetical protein
VARGAEDLNGRVLFTGTVCITLYSYVVSGDECGDQKNYAPGPGDSVHFDMVFSPMGSTVAIGLVGQLFKPANKKTNQEKQLSLHQGSLACRYCLENQTR